MTTSTSQDPRLLLMGCGSVGGVIAGGLLRAGHDVTIVAHNEDICQAIDTAGRIGPERLHAQCRQYMNWLGIAAGELEQASYSDMLA